MANLIVNGDFETGTFSGWTVGSTQGGAFDPVISTVQAHSPTHSAQIGTLPSSGAEQNGDCWIYQDVTIPATGTWYLSFWYWAFSQDDIRFDWQECQIQTTSGSLLVQVYKSCLNIGAWRQMAYDMYLFAGQTVRIWFNAHGDGAGDYTYLYLDDVQVSDTAFSPTNIKYWITDNRNFTVRYVDNNDIIHTPALISADENYIRDNVGFIGPWGACTDPLGKFVYMVDEGAELVYQIDSTTFALRTVAGLGRFTQAGALSWAFRDIFEVTCDSHGNLAVGDAGNNEIVGVNMNITSQTMLGVTIAPGNAALLVSSTAGNGLGNGMVFDPSDNLYATKQGNTGGLGNVVIKVDTAGTQTIFAGATGVHTNTGDGGPPGSATLDSPFQLSLDHNGILFVIANGLNGSGIAVIRGINTSGTTQTVNGVTIAPNTIETVFTFGSTADPWYTLPDNLGNLYICDVGNITPGHSCAFYILDSSGVKSVVAGSSAGTCGLSGDGGPATSALIGEAFGVALIPIIVPPGLFCGGQPIQAVGNPLAKANRQVMA